MEQFIEKFSFPKKREVNEMTFVPHKNTRNAVGELASD